MTRRSLYAPLAVAALGAIAPAAAASGAKTSHAKLWQNSAITILCGVEIHPKSKPATNILCSANNLPVPKHKVGDPFVQISAHGKPVVVYLSQFSFVGTKTVTLKPHAKWELARRQLHRSVQDREVREQVQARIHDRQGQVQAVLERLRHAARVI